jgi:hypothetical protein
MNQKSVFEAFRHIVEFVKSRFCIQVIITVHINKLVRCFRASRRGINEFSSKLLIPITGVSLF